MTMSETVLVNAATVLAGASTAVIPYTMAVPPTVDFRVACDQTHTVKFYVAAATFSNVLNSSNLSSETRAGVASTVGTDGNVYEVSALGYPYIACVVTNDSASPAVITVTVGYRVVAEAPVNLFSVAEARAFDKGQLSDAVDFPSATIILKEAEIREWLERVCAVNFIPTAYIDELHDGDGTSGLMLDWPLPSTPIAGATRIGATWTALTADELSALQFYETGLAVRDGSYWPRGCQNVRLSYTAGYDDVPLLIKRAALLACVFELQPSNLSAATSEYDAEGMRASYSIGDGYNGNWHVIPEVRRAIRLYSRNGGGIA